MGAPKGTRACVWLKPELVAEIEFAGWTSDGLVRQAAFKGLREDKPAAEVEAEKPRLRQRQMCRSRRADIVNPPGSGGKVDVMGVLISNPDKPLWPDATTASRSPRTTLPATTKPSAPG